MSLLESVLVAIAGLAAGTINTVNSGLFERRLQDAKVPVPSNADGQLRSLWQEPWFVWVVTVGRERFRRGFINAGAAGHFLFGLNNDGDVQLAPQASSLVWHTLRDAVADAPRGDAECSGGVWRRGRPGRADPRR